MQSGGPNRRPGHGPGNLYIRICVQLQPFASFGMGPHDKHFGTDRTHYVSKMLRNDSRPPILDPINLTCLDYFVCYVMIHALVVGIIHSICE